ncbi:hypothetical protein D3C81_2145100 [compost metagenome]
MGTPVGAFTGLRVLLIGSAVDEVDFGLQEHHLSNHRVVVPQGMPADRKVDQWRVDEGHRHLALDLDDFQAVDLVGTAP